MFPFNLSGPSFLGFYIGVGLLLGIMYWWYPPRHKPSDKNHTKAFFNAPYELAYLNLAQDHCLSVCAFNLIDRGLMTVTESGDIHSLAKFTKQVNHPLEHALILYAAGTAKPLFSADKNSFVKAALNTIDASLKQKGLLNHAALFSPLKFGCVLILFGLGIIKIIVALEQGHNNVGLLVVLMCLFVLGIGCMTGPRVTSDGRKHST